jgi:hypothetical protein
MSTKEHFATLRANAFDLQNAGNYSGSYLCLVDLSWLMGLQTKSNNLLNQMKYWHLKLFGMELRVVARPHHDPTVTGQPNAKAVHLDDLLCLASSSSVTSTSDELNKWTHRDKLNKVLQLYMGGDN